MSTVLYIKANPKPEGASRTFKISDKFIEAYKEHNPDDTIVTLDLYKEGIAFLSAEGVRMHFMEPGEGRSDPILKYAYQFLDADKYVFAEPLWNLSIPAILKAYIDYISVANITFKYTAEGPVGLCNNKKAVNITSRGGNFSEGELVVWEMGDRYLRIILGYLGITDFTTIAADNLDAREQDAEAIIAGAITRAQAFAKSF